MGRRRARRSQATWLALLAACATSLACSAILGIDQPRPRSDDDDAGTPQAGLGGAGGSGATGGAAGSATAGAAGASGAGTSGAAGASGVAGAGAAGLSGSAGTGGAVSC